MSVNRSMGRKTSKGATDRNTGSLERSDAGSNQFAHSMLTLG